jgi:hypothetical protein
MDSLYGLIKGANVEDSHEDPFYPLKRASKGSLWFKAEWRKIPNVAREGQISVESCDGRNENATGCWDIVHHHTWDPYSNQRHTPWESSLSSVPFMSWYWRELQIPKVLGILGTPCIPNALTLKSETSIWQLVFAYIINTSATFNLVTTPSAIIEPLGRWTNLCENELRLVRIRESSVIPFHAVWRSCS